MDTAQIKTNLVSGAIIALLATAAGYLLGTNEMAQVRNDLRNATERLDRWDKTAEGRRKFMNDAGRRVEYLCDHDNDCRLRFPPMDVPE